MGGRLDVPHLLAPSHRYRPHRHKNRKRPAYAADLDHPADGRGGSADPLSARRLLAHSAQGAAWRRPHRLRLIVPCWPRRGRWPPESTHPNRSRIASCSLVCNVRLLFCSSSNCGLFCVLRTSVLASFRFRFSRAASSENRTDNS